MNTDKDSVDFELLIKKMYGSVRAFTELNKLDYFRTIRAIKNPANVGYKEYAKNIGAILLRDAQKIRFIDDERNDFRVKILIQYGSIKGFSEALNVEYHNLWRYITGKCYVMNDDLRAAFIKAGFIDERAAA
jgi:hypothetical protein